MSPDIGRDTQAFAPKSGDFGHQFNYPCPSHKKRYNSAMIFDTIFFDLDSTLYSHDSGLWEAIADRINLYMRDIMGLPPDQISDLRRKYYLEYGTTLRGLHQNFSVDQAEYLNFVHDVPMQSYLQPAPKLRTMLLSIPHRRWVYTNSDKNHARRVLSALEIEDCFEGIIDIWDQSPYCKPQPESFQQALKFVGDPEPQACVFLDDSPRNLVSAKEMGFFCILIGQDGTHPFADRSMVDILELQTKVPEIWNNNRQTTKDTKKH